MRPRSHPWHVLILATPLLLAACTPAGTDVEPTARAPTPVATEPGQSPAPAPTSRPPTPPPPASPTPPRTETPLPQPRELTEPVLPVGALASLTASDDLLQIQGEVEVVSINQIVIRDFVYLAAEAPGVDIRLGVGDDFSDEVALSLKDITGYAYEGRNVTLTIPPQAAGRTFTSIGVFCYATGDLFDFAEFSPLE